MRNKFFIAALFAFVAGSFCAQQRIQNFNLFLANNSVVVKFTITKGSQCAGYTIWWSADSINYSPVYSYAGICGDAVNDQDQSYTHLSPAFNQVNFYKVELNGLEISQPKRIYVSQQGLLRMTLFPNPVVTNYDLLNFKIYDVNNLDVVGIIFNQFGKPMGELKLKTQGDTGTVPVFALDNGLYVLWITDGDNVYSSKFIVYR